MMKLLPCPKCQKDNCICSSGYMKSHTVDTTEIKRRSNFKQFGSMTLSRRARRRNR